MRSSLIEHSHQNLQNGHRDRDENYRENSRAPLISAAQPTLDDTEGNTIWRSMDIYDS